MDALRIGGIMSGLDTNGIVETLTKQAKQTYYSLEKSYTNKTLEKSIYQSISSDLVSIKADLLNLKLETTFKSKNVSVSNSSILSATASTSAKNGSHTIKVSQTARNSYTYSQFTNVALSEKGAGVTSISGRPEDFLEGVHNVTISTNTISAADYYVSKDEFSPNNLGQISKYSGSSISIVDTKGELTADLSGNFSISINSTIYSVSVSAVTGDDINKVTKSIEDSLNNQLNSANNTTNKNYLAVRVDFDSTSGSWNMAIYDTSLESLNIEVQSDSISQSLGLHNGASSTTTKSVTTKILKYHVADSYTNLLTKLNDSSAGLIPGVTLTADTSLSDGAFKIAQDSSLNVGVESYSKVIGATVSSGSGLNTSVIGLQNAGFAKTPSTSTNGTFTINGVSITIDDHTALSVNDLIAKINSSGAGVTASYDSIDDKVVLKSNTSGAENITLGDFSDTSDILSVLKLTAADGATKSTGSSNGSIDPTVKLNSAGFTKAVTSGIFTINGVSIYVDASVDTLNDVIYKVNNSGANVEMAYDEVSDKITLRSKNSIDKIVLGSSNDTSSFLEALNLTNDTTTSSEFGVAGQYAMLNVDGINYIRNTNKIDDIISGVTLNIKNASDEYTAIDISTDTTKAVEYFAKFVQHYNQMIDKLSPPEIDDEDKQYLTPLTEDEKGSMTSEEVTNYEEKWKTYTTYDIISKSSELRLLKNSLRSNLLSEATGITGAYSSLSEIGISIAGNGDISILKKGMLVKDSTNYDEILSELKNNETFLNALSENPDDVFKLFAENSSTATGWARKYESVINQYVSTGGLISLKIQPFGTIDRQLYNLTDRMDEEQTRLTSYLERVWSQFSYMETQIASLQEQGNYLTQLLASQN
ncbi:flagellar filament capping protein FliD [Deferribacteraceae bacterium V6Fe1]|nr:flagellar filament capping protein FliD [Deferribacteraceae bacterium V6Fe1]